MTYFCRAIRVMGRLVRESFDARMALVQEEITTETGRHVADLPRLHP